MYSTIRLLELDLGWRKLLQLFIITYTDVYTAMYIF